MYKIYLFIKDLIYYLLFSLINDFKSQLTPILQHSEPSNALTKN